MTILHCHQPSMHNCTRSKPSWSNHLEEISLLLIQAATTTVVLCGRCCYAISNPCGSVLERGGSRQSLSSSILRCAPQIWAIPPVRLGLSRSNSGKIPVSERLLEFPSRVRLGSPKPYISNTLMGSFGRGSLQKIFRNRPRNFRNFPQNFRTLS